jgi:hypothetical protein
MEPPGAMFPDTYTVLPGPLTTTALLKLAPLATGTRSMLMSDPFFEFVAAVTAS